MSEIYRKNIILRDRKKIFNENYDYARLSAALCKIIKDQPIKNGQRREIIKIIRIVQNLSDDSDEESSSSTDGSGRGSSVEDEDVMEEEKNDLCEVVSEGIKVIRTESNLTQTLSIRQITKELKLSKKFLKQFVI
ncbi:hypothetical protein HA402_014559 [Bradysia odoriphaga]|nr:hypothetical protein HA402_014559 [Bradysia odoriphaga]